MRPKSLEEELKRFEHTDRIDINAGLQKLNQLHDIFTTEQLDDLQFVVSKTWNEANKNNKLVGLRLSEVHLVDELFNLKMRLEAEEKSEDLIHKSTKKNALDFLKSSRDLIYNLLMKPQPENHWKNVKLFSEIVSTITTTLIPVKDVSQAIENSKKYISTLEMIESLIQQKNPNFWNRPRDEKLIILFGTKSSAEVIKISLSIIGFALALTGGILTVSGLPMVGLPLFFLGSAIGWIGKKTQIGQEDQLKSPELEAILPVTQPLSKLIKDAKDSLNSLEVSLKATNEVPGRKGK